MRIPVQVPADPRAEGERERGTRDLAPVGGDQLFGGIEQALLEEPEAVTNLVDDARPLGAHLVGLPEDGDLLGRALGHVLARVEVGQQPTEPGLRLQDGAPRRLGRVRGEHELERDALGRPCQRGGVDPRPPQTPDRLGQGLPGDAVLALDVSATADAMVLLGDVRQLEEERERPQDLRLLLEIELRDRAGELGAHLRIAGLARSP